MKINHKIIAILIIIAIPLISAASYWDYLTIGFADKRYCKQGGDCILANLTVTNVINITVTNYNVTGNMFVDGNITVNTINANKIVVTTLNVTRNMTVENITAFRYFYKKNSTMGMALNCSTAGTRFDDCDVIIGYVDDLR